MFRIAKPHWIPVLALLATLFFALPIEVAAQTLRMANILTDNMVLQRDRPVRIWGWAAPGAEVKVAITEDAKLAGPIVGKAPKVAPVVVEAKYQVPRPPKGAYHATIEYRQQIRKEQVAAAQAAVDEYETALAAYNKLWDEDKKKTKAKPPKLSATKPLRESGPLVQKMIDQSRANRPDGPPAAAWMTLPPLGGFQDALDRQGEGRSCKGTAGTREVSWPGSHFEKHTNR